MDVFSLGVCLFIMAVGHPPFNDANQKDKAYSFMSSGEYDLFWEAHLGKGQSKESRELDKSLKDLIQLMLNPDPRTRITVQQIYRHSWMQSPRITKYEFRKKLSKIIV